MEVLLNPAVLAALINFAGLVLIFIQNMLLRVKVDTIKKTTDAVDVVLKANPIINRKPLTEIIDDVWERKSK